MNAGKGPYGAIDGGEGRVVALSALLACSALALNVLVVGSLTALFLGARSRAELPYGYAAMSLFGVLASGVMLSISGRVTRAREAHGVFIALGLALLFSLVLLPWLGSGFLHVAYPTCLGLSALSIVQAYAVINDCLDPAQAKRLFPTIGLGGTLGAMGAGAAMAFIAPLFGTRALLGLALLVLVVVAVSAQRLVVTHLPDRAMSERPPIPVPQTTLRRFFRDAHHLLVRDRLVARFALAQFVVWTASTLLRYQFESSLAHELSRDKIAAFLGIFNLISNAAVLLLQASLEARILRAFGLSVGLTSTSAVLGLGVPLLFVGPAFWLVGALRFLEQTFRFSLSRTAEELLLLPLKSTQRRKARTLVTAALVPLAVFSAAMLVIALSAFSPPVLVVFTWLMALAGFALSLSLKPIYAERLRDSLVKPRPSLSLSTTPSLVMRVAAFDTEARAALELKLVDANADERRRRLFRALEQPNEAHLAEVVAALDAPGMTPAAVAVLCEWPDERVVAVASSRAAVETQPRTRAIGLRILARLPHASATHALEGLVRAGRDKTPIDVLHALRRRRLHGAPLTLQEAEILEFSSREAQRGNLFAQLAGQLDQGPLSQEQRTAAKAMVVAEAAFVEERVFAWLSLLYPIETLERAHLSLRAGDRRAAAFALEVLEHTLPPKIFRELFEARALGTSARRPANERLDRLPGAGLEKLLDALDHSLARPLGLYLQVFSATQKDLPMALVETMVMLRRVPLFAELSSEELRAIAELVESRTLAAGEVVFREGDPAEAFFVVMSGELQQAEGQSPPARLQKGECFGQLSLLAAAVHSATVTTLTKVELGRISATEFDDLLEASPGIARALLKVLARRPT